MKLSSLVQLLLKNRPLLYALIIATIYIGPLLVFPGFSVIDDGWTLHITHDLKHAAITQWPGILVESAIGRLRPVYYLYFFVIYLIGGANPFWFWLGQWAVLAVTLYLMFKILYAATKNEIISLGGIVVPFLFTALPENLYRLGTQEPKQFMFELLFLWWALKLNDKRVSLQQAALGPIILILALGSKETSLVLIPLFVTIFVMKFLDRKWRSVSHLALAVTLALVGFGFYLLIPPAKSYSLEYSLSLSRIMQTAQQVRLTELHVFWLFGVTGCLAAVRLYFFAPTLNIFKVLKDHFWHFWLFAAVIGSWLIILPWSLQMERYYYNVTLFVLMLLTVEVASWWALRPKIAKLNSFQTATILLAILVLTVGVSRVFFSKQIPKYHKMVANTILSMKGWFSGYQNNYIVTKYLMDHTSPDGTFYAAYADYEVVYDMGQFARLFGDRDIIIYHANPQLAKDFGYPYLFVEDPYAAYIADPGPKILVDKSTNPKLDMLPTPHQDLVPKVTFYKELKDLWSVTHSP